MTITIAESPLTYVVNVALQVCFGLPEKHLKYLGYLINTLVIIATRLFLFRTNFLLRCFAISTY